MDRRLFCASALSLASGCKFGREAATGPRPIEAAVFEGGYGIKWHLEVARAYEKAYPDRRVNLWGEPRVDEKLRPRILRRNPPELATCTLPAWKLIVAGKLHPLDEALDSPAEGHPGKTWRQTLAPGVLTSSQYQGKTYAMPSNLGAWTCWYNAAQFRKFGWKAPTTWDEFLTLCQQVKQDGVAPLAFQGKYPNYAWYTTMALFQRLSTWEQYYRVQDADPGAFQCEPFIEACAMIQDMAKRFFQPGAMAMTHTESQMEWVNGRAAMVYCGLWLKNEMKKAIPEGFEMACFPVPSVKEAPGDPTAIYGGGGESFYVFRDSPNPAGGAEFLRYMMSLEHAKRYVAQLDTLSTIQGCAEGVETSSALKSAVAVVSRASRMFGDRLSDLYLGWAKGVRTETMGELVQGKITPKQAAQKLEAGLELIRRDPDIYKPPAMGVPAV